MSIRKIINIVGGFYNIKTKEILGCKRNKKIVMARHIACYLCRKELKSSFPFIGRRFGGKDHTTAMYACEKIQKELEKNQNLSEEINLIKQMILC